MSDNIFVYKKINSTLDNSPLKLSELSVSESFKILLEKLKLIKAPFSYELFPQIAINIKWKFDYLTNIRANPSLLINDLEESTYAVAIYHDQNSNKKFDTFFAIPKEKYGFSNDAPVLFGPPKFKQAEFYVGQSDMIEIEIRLR